MNAIREVLAIPFGWALGALYDLSGNYLLSLIVITLVLRLALLPFAVTQQKNSAKQMRLQAKVNKIRAKYAGQGREAQMKISEETQELYRREGFNANTAGCLPMLFQFVVMIGLYGAIYAPLTRVLHISDAALTALSDAYYQVMGTAADAARDAYRIQLNILNKFDQIVPLLQNGGDVKQTDIDSIQGFIDHFTIFGINLTEMPNEWKTIGFSILLIPIFAGVTSLLTAGYTYIKQRRTNPEMAKNPAMGCMSLTSPIISIVFSYTLPAGVGFYWIISNILAFIQIIALDVLIKPADIIAGQMIDETVERRSREQSVKKRKELLDAKNANGQN